MVTEYGDTHHGVSRVDTGDSKFEPHLPTTVGEGQFVSKLPHDEDTFTRHLSLGRQVAKGIIVEARPLVDHLYEEATSTGAHRQRHRLGGVSAVAMDDGILYRLQRRHADGRVIVTHMTKVAKMKQTLLNRGEEGNIGLYDKLFRHSGIGETIYKDT